MLQKNVRELYDLSNPSTPTAKYTIPILWDKKNSVIVNNESEEIVRIFNSCFNAFAKNPSLDVYPAHLKEIIDGVNSQVYPNINNGVYRTGFAKTQLAYDDASKNLFNTMDHFEKVLSTQRYLCGNVFTEADLRLFVTLIRFDEVYTVHFKTNTKQLREYPNLFNHTKDIYQMSTVDASVDMDHIKKHYYCSHAELNKFHIVPTGPNVDFTSPHDRERMY